MARAAPVDPTVPFTLGQRQPWASKEVQVGPGPTEGVPSLALVEGWRPWLRVVRAEQVEQPGAGRLHAGAQGVEWRACGLRCGLDCAHVPYGHRVG